MKYLSLCTGFAAVVICLLFGLRNVEAESAEKGKAQFIKVGCWQCHGTAGQGTIAGPKLAPDPLPFETLSTIVRATSRQMPPYREKVLSDADLADIYAYLVSIPKSRDYKSLPLLAQ